jgi:hypothetical protein
LICAFNWNLMMCSCSLNWMRHGSATSLTILTWPPGGQHPEGNMNPFTTNKNHQKYFSSRWKEQLLLELSHGKHHKTYKTTNQSIDQDNMNTIWKNIFCHTNTIKYH